MPIRQYVLIGQTPVEEPDPLKWAIWFGEPSNRIVAQTEVGATVVSTVFLGIDHGLSRVPLLFETMVFTDGDSEDVQRRCATWLEAEAQHKRIVEMVANRATI